MEDYQRFDIVIGTVIRMNAYGCYVKDEETGKVVFYYGNGSKGDKVLLSVQKVDPVRRKVTCVLETVLDYGCFAA